MDLNLARSRRLRYVIVGGWNTMFGYGLSVWLYAVLSAGLHIIVISIIANICAITMSFTTYKLFVFKTKGEWFNEYMRSYVVYGSAAVIGTLFLWIMVDYFNILFWVAQGVGIILTVLISYVGHKRITFSRCE